MNAYLRQCPECRIITDSAGKRIPSIVVLKSVPQIKCLHDCMKKHVVDHKKMQEVTEDGIKRSFENAHEEWRAMALHHLHQLCISKETFTVNDLRDIVRSSPLKTHDNRAMGGVIVTGKKNGWLAPTGESIPSVIGHKVHIQIWKSLIYKQ